MSETEVFIREPRAVLEPLCTLLSDRECIDGICKVLRSRGIAPAGNRVITATDLTEWFEETA